MPKKSPLFSGTIIIPTLRLKVWERPYKGACWGASITNATTNETLVKVYGESERKAVGTAGYELYSNVFHEKTLGEVQNKTGGKPGTEL